MTDTRSTKPLRRASIKSENVFYEARLLSGYAPWEEMPALWRAMQHGPNRCRRWQGLGGDRRSRYHGILVIRPAVKRRRRLYKGLTNLADLSAWYEDNPDSEATGSAACTFGISNVVQTMPAGRLNVIPH